MNILLVESDPELASAAQSALLDSGHSVSTVSCGESAVSFLKANGIDLVVLDLQLPDVTGFDILNWIRFNLSYEPAVLCLTSKGVEAEIVRALEAGADEYVIKPFGESELASRVAALLHRTKRNEKPASTISLGHYVIDTIRQSVTLRGNAVELTTKEFSIVACIFTNAGRLVPRDFLVKFAWGRELQSTSRTVDTHIYRLRKKLALGPENGVRLSTVYTHGYRLDAVDATAGNPDFADIPAAAVIRKMDEGALEFVDETMSSSK
ncbi:response regulator transcription factor [Paraburkholderia sp. J76]|uniref:response regulator transcription factor n=1 Tax=Paraburkholderia sp. J76 TaxID=2805439 RepID=UPI002ABD3D80|nr:response regulator transcription factor [Paraburkholderia sp. J76]